MPTNTRFGKIAHHLFQHRFPKNVQDLDKDRRNGKSFGLGGEKDQGRKQLLGGGKRQGYVYHAEAVLAFLEADSSPPPPQRTHISVSKNCSSFIRSRNVKERIHDQSGNYGIIHHKIFYYNDILPIHKPLFSNIIFYFEIFQTFSNCSSNDRQ